MLSEFVESWVGGGRQAELRGYPTAGDTSCENSLNKRVLVEGEKTKALNLLSRITFRDPAVAFTRTKFDLSVRIDYSHWNTHASGARALGTVCGRASRTALTQRGPREGTSPAM